MKILVIDDRLQEKVHNAFKKEGHTMMYILEPQLVESYIMDFEPDLILIRSDSNSCNIIYAFPRLPIVLYSTENDDSLNELKATVKNIMYDLNMSTLHLRIDNQVHHGKSLV